MLVMLEEKIKNKSPAEATDTINKVMMCRITTFTRLEINYFCRHSSRQIFQFVDCTVNDFQLASNKLILGISIKTHTRGLLSD